MTGTGKKIIVFGGPNGSGKTTAAELLIPQTDDIIEFVNADKIAAGLSPYNAGAQAVQSGKLMLARLRLLIRQEQNFSFETTLATRSFVPYLKYASEMGYHLNLYYLWLPDVAFAKKRVAQRVVKGGHDIPANEIERRYHRSLENLKNLYWDLFDLIKIYDGSQTPPELVATKERNLSVINEDIWKKI